jgi:nitrogen fixation NifU-like protein
MQYSDKVEDHFRNPRNLGEIKNPSGSAMAGNPVCGDVMQLQILVKEGVIEDIKFKTFGCAAAVATTSMLTTLVKGKTLEEAKKVTFADVKEALGGLPCAKVHCSQLAVTAFLKAVADYEKNNMGK